VKRVSPPPLSKQARDFLRPYDPAVRKLALALRDLVLRELGTCHENVYDAYNAVAISYGTSPHLRDGICHIAVYTNYANLGFHHGAALDDPGKLLRGTGRSIRHLRVASPDDIARPELREFIRKAKAHAGVVGDAKAPRVSSRVKAVYPRKRRPRQRAGAKPTAAAKAGRKMR